MSDEKLICGCGGEIKVENISLFCRCQNPFYYFFNCQKCRVFTCARGETKAEAIAAFEKATRADIKQGIQWISVKDRLPEKTMTYLVSDGNSVWASTWHKDAQRFTSKPKPTHWAEINLPDKET